MRRHFYLVTAHDDEERVGTIMTTEGRRSKPLKNEEGATHVIDNENGDIEEVGKLVGLGYEDFEDEDDLDERAAEVIQSKLDDIDREWLEKAGVKEVLEA